MRVDVAWLDPERLDPRDVAGVAALLEAARAVDAPHLLAPLAPTVAAHLALGWDGDPPLTAVARDEHDRITGVLELSLPRWDNTHLAEIDITVDPVERRQRLGRRLFDLGVERVRATGRTLIVAECFDATAGVPFLLAMGLERAYEEVQRRQHLVTLDRKRLEDERSAALDRAAAYELVRIPGATPEDMLADVARMTGAINDAPTDALEIEDEVFTADRIRSFERTQLAQRRRVYRLVARERATGVLAGHTMVVVDAERPARAWQYDTSVLRAHRGHRLGLLLKASMLGWLGEEEPQLRMIDTWNAASNQHMIRVNEILGYEVLATAAGWQRHV